jgi:hypothetical protein
MLVVQYPRGAAAIVWLDPTTGAITTNHAGLQAMLRAGVRNWEGHVVHPHEGPKFLSAVYDYLFPSGYPVYWKRMGAMRGVQNTYRV